MATYSFDTFYLTFGGSLPGGEVWQCGLHCRSDVPLTQANTQAFATAAAGAVRACVLGTGVGSLFATGQTLSRVRVYAYPAGATASIAIADGVFTPVVGAGVPLMPNQVAVVASLRTSLITAQGRGRIYWPNTLTAITAGQLTPTQATNIANDTRGLIVALNALPQVGDTIAGSAGNPITTVVVNTVLDTQRRRAQNTVVAGVATVVV